MSKIYSRKRFILKPDFEMPKKTFIIKRKILKIIIIFMVLILCFRMMLNYIEPIFEAMCEDKVKSIATIISNQESTVVMNKYQYDELYTIEKDEAGNIVIIRSNVVPINNLISDLTENIQNRFNELEKTQINIPIGNLFGTYFFSGVGPNIPIKVVTSGTIENEIKSEFIAKGINQTLHRIYVDFQCNVRILTPIKNYEKTVTNQFIIAEHVIVGNIPGSYYNFNGVDNPDDTLNMIK